jgi:hypothetical protein
MRPERAQVNGSAYVGAAAPAAWPACFPYQELLYRSEGVISVEYRKNQGRGLYGKNQFEPWRKLYQLEKYKVPGKYIAGTGTAGETGKSVSLWHAHLVSGQQN